MGSFLNKAEEELKISSLQRALFYEVQYRNAILTNSLSFYDINVTNDLIENDFFFKTPEGTLVSVLDYVGLSAPCKFTEFIAQWTMLMIPETSQKSLKNLDKIKDTLIDYYNEGKREYTLEYWVERKNGKKIFINQKFLLLKNEKDEICALSVIKDSTNTISKTFLDQQKIIEEYAFYDPITKGYNYIKFKDKVNKQSSSGVIVSLDIHSFKIINSICGIIKGDEVIKCIWDCIMQIIDTENGDLAAHINADHFIIFLPTFDTEKIKQKLKNLTYMLNLLSADLEVPQLQPYFGIAFWQPDKRIELSYSEAVTAKNNAKNENDHNYAYFEDKDTSRLVEEKILADSFEEAIAAKAFKIWYQPKFSPITKELVGAEALVRWQRNDELLQPSVFIPLFEKNGMIRILDEYVFRVVCEQLKKWQDQGHNIVPISINLSRASLYFEHIAQRYTRIIKKIGIDTKYVPIEITESAAVNNNDIVKIADDFYNAGFVLHMDDFGSGYSSLATLNTMHFETLKLDKSLIDYIGNFSGNRLIEHTISLAKELGIHVTAEGVENENQVSFLNYIGCDSIQGFYYSKPVVTEEFEKLLDTKKDQTSLSIDYLAQHINQFTLNFNKFPEYKFTINLTDNTFTETDKNTKWRQETGIQTCNYMEATNILYNDFIMPESKESFLAFMDRTKLLNNFCGTEETRIFDYSRMMYGTPTKLRLLTNIFKIHDSDNVWMYISITKLN